MKKGTILPIAAIIAVLVMVIGATYAFFADQGGLPASKNTTITSNTTDLLSFSISNDIGFRVKQSDLASGGNNKSGEATVTATLIPNNNTGSATDHYYIYLNLMSNSTTYSSANTNHQAELMVQVFDGNNNLVTIPSLGTQTTVKGVTGYDITGLSGAYALVDNHEITASNYTQTVENWRVVITLINLDVNQNDNTNKEIEATLIIQKNSMSRTTPVVEPDCDGQDCGIVETVIKPEPVVINNENEEIYTIYTVGYIEGNDTTSTNYSIDIRNLGVDLTEYTLELYGEPAVMTTLFDFEQYIEMKNNGVPLTNITTGNNRKAIATANELYTYSLGTNELTINSVTVSCDDEKCTASISESFGDYSSRERHATVTNDNIEKNLLYNGIKFNLRKKDVAARAIHITYSNPTKTDCTEAQCAIDELYEKLEYNKSRLSFGLSETKEAGLYRYQGINADNYICFGTTNKNTCVNDTVKYMYRIIGINDSNQMKLVKKEALNTAYAWDSVCGTNNKWADSTLYNSINGSVFLNNTNYVPSGWSSRIATTSWKYGDIANTNLTPQQIVSTENSFSDSVNAKIGLMYFSDYIYTFPNGNNCDGTSSTLKCKNSWILLSRNDSSSPSGYEWTMFRYEQVNLCNPQVWAFHSDSLTAESELANNLYSVRPVFYLTSNQTIASGSGTLGDPFILN